MLRMRALLAALVLLGACEKPAREADDSAAERTSGRPAPAAASTALFLGDSVTAGLGVDADDAWPALVGAEWERRGLPWRARNAAVSGSTSAGALEAARWALTPDVRIVFVCIGANDGLRGTPLAETRKNVDRLLAELKKEGRLVALAGMKLPPNYGRAYTEGFASLFGALAEKHKVAFMPFLLEGVAAKPALNQPDGIHPNAEGHRIIANSVLKFLDEKGLPPKGK